MTRRGELAAVAAALCASLTFAPPARAEESEPIRVVYQAQDGCPSGASFIADVQERTARARIVEEGERRVFEIILENVPAGSARGTLVVRGDGRPSTRVLDGQSCAEVASALALIMALTIDPRASTAPTSITPPTATPAAAPAEPVHPPEPKPAEERVEPPPPPASQPLVPTTRARWVFGVGPEAGVRTGVLPSSALLLGGLIIVSDDSRALFAPSIRLALGAATSAQTAQVGTSAVVVNWFGARSELCPLRIGLSADVAIRPCALVEIGSTSSRGEGVSDPQDQSRAGVGGGGSVDVRWELRPFFVSGDVLLIAPFRPDRYYAGPGTTLYQQPQVGVGFALAVGVLPFSASIR